MLKEEDQEKKAWKRILEIERSSFKKEVSNKVKCFDGKLWGAYQGNNSALSY